MKRIGIVVLALLALKDAKSQIQKKWYVQMGYSISGQSIIRYSEPQISKQFLSYFQVTDFRDDINFFYLGAEQQFKLSDSSKSRWVWGAYLAKKGYKSVFTFVSSGNKITIKDYYAFYYANFPLYIQRHIWKNLYINYGVVPSVMFYNRNDYLYENKIVSTPAHMPEFKVSSSQYFYEKQVNYIDLSVRLGASYYVSGKLGIDFYYDKGVININRNNGVPDFIGYQNIWLLGLRYSLK